MKSKSTYKDRLLKAKELRSESGANAFDRVALLVEVFNDRDFRLDCGNVDDFRAAETLDAYVDDLCRDFLELKQMIEFYPKREQWSDGKLNTMHRAMMQAIEERNASERSQAGNKRKPKQQEFTQADYNSLLLRAENAVSMRKQIQQQCDRLQAENRDLKAENERLRKENSELKRQLNKEADDVFDRVC